MSLRAQVVVVQATRAICAQHRSVVNTPLFVTDDSAYGWRITHVRAPESDRFLLRIYPPMLECLPGEATVLVTEEHLKVHIRKWMHTNECARSVQRAWRRHHIRTQWRLLMSVKKTLPVAIFKMHHELPRAPRLALASIRHRPSNVTTSLWPIHVPDEPLAAPAVMRWSEEHLGYIQERMGGSFAEDLFAMTPMPQSIELWDDDVFMGGVLFSVFGFQRDGVFLSIASLVSAEPRCGAGSHLVHLLHRMISEVPYAVLGCQSTPSAMPFWVTKMEFQRIDAYDLLLDEQCNSFGQTRYPGCTFVVR